jgi:hypothetical protein
MLKPGIFVCIVERVDLGFGIYLQCGLKSGDAHWIYIPSIDKITWMRSYEIEEMIEL